MSPGFLETGKRHRSPGTPIRWIGLSCPDPASPYRWKEERASRRRTSASSGAMPWRLLSSSGLMAGFTEEIGRNRFALPRLRIHFGVPTAGLFPGFIKGIVWNVTSRLPGDPRRLRPSLAGAYPPLDFGPDHDPVADGPGLCRHRKPSADESRARKLYRVPGHSPAGPRHRPVTSLVRTFHRPSLGDGYYPGAGWKKETGSSCFGTWGIRRNI
jgi:hypothetical protein